jgi:hypothetical protein
MRPVEYDIGSGVAVGGRTCPACRFNSTEEKDLDKAIVRLRKKEAAA